MQEPHELVNPQLSLKGFILHQLAAHIKKSGYEGANPARILSYIQTLLAAAPQYALFSDDDFLQQCQNHLKIYQDMGHLLI